MPEIVPLRVLTSGPNVDKLVTDDKLSLVADDKLSLVADDKLSLVANDKLSLVANDKLSLVADGGEWSFDPREDLIRRDASVVSMRERSFEIYKGFSASSAEDDGNSSAVGTGVCGLSVVNDGVRRMSEVGSWSSSDIEVPLLSLFVSAVERSVSKLSVVPGIEVNKESSALSEDGKISLVLETDVSRLSVRDDVRRTSEVVSS